MRLDAYWDKPMPVLVKLPLQFAVGQSHRISTGRYCAPCLLGQTHARLGETHLAYSSRGTSIAPKNSNNPLCFAKGRACLRKLPADGGGGDLLRGRF